MQGHSVFSGGYDMLLCCSRRQQVVWGVWQAMEQGRFSKPNVRKPTHFQHTTHKRTRTQLNHPQTNPGIKREGIVGTRDTMLAITSSPAAAMLKGRICTTGLACSARLLQHSTGAHRMRPAMSAAVQTQAPTALQTAARFLHYEETNDLCTLQSVCTPDMKWR
jgi:hypothetical protein